METLAQSQSTAPRPGQILGRYELLLPLAKGGMAQVWAARLRGTRGFQKLVAIKTILADAMEGTRAEQMFLEEATLAAQVHHPNVVSTLELGEHDGSLYLVMEWVNGESLSQVLLKAADVGGVPLPLAVDIVSQACKGLHAAHEARDESGALLGIVHRDVSPQNVLVSYTGTTKLVDFGIAKATARASELTHQGEIKGKFAYMAPEQVSGAAIDRRVDIFGMGVLLYALTTGRHPFRGGSAGETLRNICVNAPPRPTELCPGYPPALERAVLKALAKSPDARFATAHEFLTELESATPESLGSREAETAAFLRQLFGNRSTQRMNEIRMAQKLADGVNPTASSTSVSSLRAVSIAQLEELDLSQSAELSVVSGHRPLPEVAAAPPPGGARSWPAYAGGALVLVVLAFAWERGGRALGSVSGSASAGVPLQPSGLVSGAASSSGGPSSHLSIANVTATASGQAQASPQPKEVPPATPAPDRKRGQGTGERLIRPRVAVSMPAPAKTVAASSASPPIAPTHIEPEASGARKPNAWNADNYGGRR